MNHLDIINRKIVPTEHLSQLLSFYRFKEQKIVFTNGCFDIIHRGHIEYLAKAASLGDVLILGLNTDDSIKRLKGDSRPIQDQVSRALFLASFQFISHVTLFNDDTPYELIKLVQPDILVKGNDYSPESIVGYDIVKNKGGEVITIDFLEGYSTSNIVKKIKSTP